MEKLKQAVEKAKLLREQRGLASGGVSNTQTGSAVSTEKSLIKYTETKIVKISDSVYQKNRLVQDDDAFEINTAYKMLRTHVQHLLEDNGWNSIAITSANSGEGKSTTAINLALSMAKKVDQTVLLVDLDLRKPDIHKIFGYIPKFGIDDYLNNRASVSDILFNPDVDGLVVMPCRNPCRNSSEMLSSPRMLELVDEIKSRYPSRIVIFDLPPILSVEDAIVFSPYVDSVLLVVQEGKTTQREIKKSLELLKATNVLGTVLNNAVYSKTNYKNLGYN